jgi:uridine monophosphate synthetase
MTEEHLTTHPEGLTKAQEALCLQLFNIGAIKFGNFRLKLHDAKPEAPLSPVYIDLRVLRRFPEAKAAAVSVYEELVRPLKFDLLADVPTAATPLVSSLSDRLSIGMVTPRTDAKTHGSGAKVDGLLSSDKGKTAVIIDDLVTRADSKLEAAKVLEENGLVVKDVVVLIDRKQGGAEQLTTGGYALHSALTMEQMLAFYARVGKISQAAHADITQKIAALNNFLGV